MTDNEFATLVKLRDIGETVADPGSDIRGRKVVDKNLRPLGRIDALLVDEKEQKVRFFEVASGGLLGLGAAKSFIPVDAITSVTEHEVVIDQTAEKVAGAPLFDPTLVDQTPFYTITYGHYEVTPFWGMKHIQPGGTSGPNA